MKFKAPSHQYLIYELDKEDKQDQKKNRYRASNGGAREQFIEDQIWIYLLHL